MAVSAEAVKELRDRTGVSMMECKKALDQTEGDINKALAILGERASASAAKKADRTLAAGTVASYIHNQGQVGALVMLSCETDFVSKNEEFMSLARDIAMHAAAMRPTTAEDLLQQSFIKDADKTISALLEGATQKFGERIEVSQFACFVVK